MVTIKAAYAKMTVQTRHCYAVRGKKRRASFSENVNIAALPCVFSKDINHTNSKVFLLASSLSSPLISCFRETGV